MDRRRQRGRFVSGPERLEARVAFSANGFSANAPTANATEVIDWRGGRVTAVVEQWVGRSTMGLPTISAAALARDWTTTDLGDGFFSLSTPGWSRDRVLAWSAGVPGLASFDPEIELRPTAAPNDPSFATQWSLANVGQSGGRIDADIDAPEAWQITTGSRNVVVAVIDSGIDFSHPDLAANIWTNPREVAGNGVDDDANGYVDDVRGWDFVDVDNTPQDGFGHGTHVSGIIGAVGNNGIGVSGIAWQVSILPLRFQGNSGMGYTGAAISAVNYATKLRRAGVPIVASNNSWGGGTTYSSTLQAAIKSHGDAGITFVVASGNSGADSDAVPRYPSGYAGDNVIAVAATDASDNLASLSNYGLTSVDLAAPGIGILSTLPGGGYGVMSGTSMAAPHVTGAVALLAARKPGITPAEVRAAIFGSVDPLGSLAGKVATGGRLNVRAAVERVTGVPTPIPTPTPTPTPTPAPTPTLLFSDAFNRPDSTVLASPWRVVQGRFAVSNNRIVARADGNSVAVVDGIAVADATVRSVVSLGNGSNAGLVLRYSVASDGSRSMYAGTLTRTSSGVVARIWKFQAGVWTPLGAKAVSTTSGTLAFSAIGTRLSLSLDGRPIIAIDDGSIRGAGGVGYRFKGQGGSGDSFEAFRA